MSSTVILMVVVLLSGFGWNISGLGAKVDLAGVVEGIVEGVVGVVKTDRLKLVSASISIGLGVIG